MTYNQFLKERLKNEPQTKSTVIDETSVKDQVERHERCPYCGSHHVIDNETTEPELGNREKIGLDDSAPKAVVDAPEGLTEHQKALYDAVVNRFTAKKVEKFISEQMDHINLKRQLAEGIRFLFDEKGNPPANAPLEDIVSVRKKIETDIQLLESICSAMRSHLAMVKEAEEMAFDLVSSQDKK